MSTTRSDTNQRAKVNKPQIHHLGRSTMATSHDNWHTAPQIIELTGATTNPITGNVSFPRFPPFFYKDKLNTNQSDLFHSHHLFRVSKIH